MIIPTHNRLPLLLEALESLKNQEMDDFEVIVIDDGSTDGTPEAIAGLDPRLTIYSQPNRKRGAARNMGMDHARGRFLTFLDDDDLYGPTHLARFASSVEQRSDCRFFACGVDLWDPHTGSTTPLLSRRLKTSDLPRQALLGTVLQVMGIFVAQDLAKAVQFPESPAIDGSEDYVFVARLLHLATPTLFVGDVRARHHQGRGMTDLDYIKRSRFAAMEMLLTEGLGDAALSREERQLVVAGTHRFCAALDYEADDMSKARCHLRAARRALGGQAGLRLIARLYLQAILGRRAHHVARSIFRR